MATQFQFRIMSRADNIAYLGAPGEVIVLNDPPISIAVHDGVQLGGHELTRADVQNVQTIPQSIQALASSFDQGQTTPVLISFNASGTATFSVDVSGEIIQLGTLSTDRFARDERNRLISFSSANYVARDDVQTSEIENQAITVDKFGIQVISNNKIADGAITTDKIVDNTLSSNAIAPSSVTEGKLSDETVTEQKLNTRVVTSAKFSADVPVQKIALNDISGSKLNQSTITNDKLSSETENATGARHILTEEPINSFGNDGDIVYVLQ